MATALVVSTTAAQASIITAQFTGVVASGMDEGGQFFGTADFTGESFVAVMTYDDSLGTRTTYPGNYDTVEGEYATSPSISTSLTINEHTVSFTGNNYGLLSYSTPAFNGGLVQAQSVFSDQLGDFLNLNIGIGELNVPASLDLPFSGIGEKTLFTGELLTLYDASTGDYAFGSLQPTSVSATVSSAPEPCGWVLLGSGVGVAGLAFRRRRERMLAVA